MNWNDIPRCEHCATPLISSADRRAGAHEDCATQAQRNAELAEKLKPTGDAARHTLVAARLNLRSGANA